MGLKARCSTCDNWATLAGASLICSCGAFCSTKTPIQGTLPAIEANPLDEAKVARTQAQVAFSNILLRVRRRSDAWTRLKALTGGCIQFSKMNQAQCQHVLSGIKQGSFHGI